jgi:hypothetical protein
MNREDVVRLSREAANGMLSYDAEGEWRLSAAEVERFADLVAAHEREWCAKIVEPSEEHRRDASWGYLGGEEGVEMLDSLAAAIRARSNV